MASAIRARTPHFRFPLNSRRNAVSQQTTFRAMTCREQMQQIDYVPRSPERDRTNLAGELLQLIGNLSDASLSAVFVVIAAGCATDTDGGDRLVPNFYAKGSRLQGYMIEFCNPAGWRRRSDALGNGAARIQIVRGAEHDHRVGLVVRAFDRDNTSAVSA